MNVDLFNILCIPATMNLGDNDAVAVGHGGDLRSAQIGRAMYLLDAAPSSRQSRHRARRSCPGWTATAGLRSANAALYFPRMDIADPLNQLRLRSVAPSGTVAGLWARTDGARGVWKAPAGTAATLTGVQKLEYKLTDPENGVLNPLAINCLRNFPIYGPVCWGARTLNGADQMADQWKYIPVRRLALYIEESLYRGTQWVVFEPNDTPLWAQIRLNVGAFMQTLFRQGAFQGSTPQQAYFVQLRRHDQSAGQHQPGHRQHRGRLSRRSMPAEFVDHLDPADGRSARDLRTRTPWLSSPSIRSVSIPTRTSSSG